MGARHGTEDLADLLRAKSDAVGTVGGQRLVGVGDAGNFPYDVDAARVDRFGPRAGDAVLPGETAGIAATVLALVVLIDNVVVDQVVADAGPRGASGSRAPGGS